MPTNRSDTLYQPAYLNMLDQLDHAPLLATRLAEVARLQGLIRRLWPKGHPTKFIHVAGTSGKGSVCKFLEAGFGLVGHAGSYTGPHVFDYRERISVNGRPVTPAELVAAWEDVVWPLCIELAADGPHRVPGYGELGLLLSLVLFDRRGVLWAAMETGCGGRYDCRMALPVTAAVLTNVRDDHPGTLGSELWQRAIEKAGVARPDTPLFTMEHEGIAATTIADLAAHLGAELTVVGPNRVAAVDSSLRDDIPELAADSLLHATHQRANAALALAVVTRLLPQIDRAEMLRRIATMSYAGRFQQLAPDLYVDAAHNVDKVAALAAEVADRFGADKKPVFVVGLSNGRDGGAVCGSLLPHAAAMVVSQPGYKGVPAALLATSLRQHQDAGKLASKLASKLDILVEPNPAHAVTRAREMAKKLGTVVIVTGSMYMIDEALNPNPYLRHLNASYGWRHKAPGQPSGGSEMLLQAVLGTGA